MRAQPLRNLLVAVSILWATAAAAEPIAFVVAMKGAVSVTGAKGGAAAKATLGRPLERGDKVQVGAGGSASLFFSDGNVIELDGGSSMTVGGRLASLDPKHVGPGSEVSAQVFTRVSKFITSKNQQSGLVALSAMRGGSDAPAPLILAPRRSSTLSGRPDFAWRAVAGATRYRVTVTTDEGEAWSHEVPDTSLAYPADAKELAAGGDYVWSVVALSDIKPPHQEESSFHVLTAGEASQVRDHLGSIQHAAGDSTSAGRYLAGSYLVGRGLYDEAARQFEALVRLDPDAAGPHEALANVYRTVGLTDLAQAEMKRANAISTSH